MGKEKKEIGKLLKLLNEYEIKRERKFERFKRDRLPYYEWSNKELGDGSITYLWLDKEDYKGEELYGDSANAVLISKSYGFIKWLVENDKINTESGPLYGFHFIMHNRQPYSLYETILMILAISDTPIEDLVSYLK